MSDQRRDPTVDELEAQVEAQTRESHGHVLAVIEGMLNAYIAVLRQNGPFTLTEDNRAQDVWLRLVARSFNSFRWAYHLLQTGYYVQAMTLVRSGLEDWLLCMDCFVHPETIDEIGDAAARLPSFALMAQRSLPPDLASWFSGDDKDPDGTYGFLSTLAHPRHRSIALQVDPHAHTLRLGPLYDRSLFLASAYYLAEGLLRMAEFVGRSANDSSAGVVKDIFQPAIARILELTNELLAEANAALSADG